MQSLTNWLQLWPPLAILGVIAACIISDASLLTIGISLAGILFVLGVMMKKPESQLLGAVFVTLLAIASAEAGFFANAFINAGILAPLSIYGFYKWQTRKGEGLLERSLANRDRFTLLISVITFSVIASIFSVDVGSSLPILDGLTAILPVAATGLMVFAYREQWACWITYNILQVFMWCTAASLQPQVLAIAVLKVIFLINSLIGYREWKSAK